MYRLDWIEQLKLRASSRPAVDQIREVSPVVWKLGLTSFLTDISSEMVNSVLPVYLVLHLHLSPFQYGAIDGVYNGLAVILVSLAAGMLADRSRRHKEIALTGYGLSAACKLLLFAVGGVWGWLMAVVGLDRIGKGMRSAPRDALISLNTPPRLMASAFSVHRSLDAGGSLLGPIVAFFLLAQSPGAYNVLWAASFVFAALGAAALFLYVPKPELTTAPRDRGHFSRAALTLLRSKRMAALMACGLILSTATVTDGFLYLMLQQKGDAGAGFLPLFYVATAASYMLFSIPMGVCADRWGRGAIFLSGYAILGVIYTVLLSTTSLRWEMQATCLILLGLYYAGTEGVLVAIASEAIAPELRTSGFAFLATAVGFGKLFSSLLFGWLWSSYGVSHALAIFGGMLATALLIAAGLFRLNGRGVAHE